MESAEFGGSQVDVYRNENNDVFMTIDQLAKALDYADKSGVEKIVQRNNYLKREEFSTTDRLSALDGKSRKVTLFTEDGIYEVTMLSKKPKAREFRHFVRRLLKRLRKGDLKVVPSYQIDDPIERAKQWIEEEKRRQELEGEVLQLTDTVEEYEPKVQYVDTILSSKDAVTVTQIAKDYGLSAVMLNKLLHHWGVQHKVGGEWVLYAKHAKKGYTKSKTHSYARADGSTGTSIQTRWTQKGRLFIHNLLTDNGYTALMDSGDDYES